MAWLPLQDSLPEHPKLKRLARLSGMSRAEAFGTLGLIWLYALRFATDGDLTSFSEIELAEVAGRDNPGDLDAQDLINDLLSTGWLTREPDGRLVIHDWEEHLGPYLDFLEAKASARDRKRKSRAKAKAEATQTQDSHVTVPRPSQLIEQNSKPPERKPPDNPFDRLDDWWNGIQKRISGNSWDWQSMKAALELPGMPVDRIIRELDPLIEDRRKRGRPIGSFSYCLKVLESLVERDRMMASAKSEVWTPPAQVDVAKPLIQGDDHYRFLVATGTYNPDDWGNSDEYEAPF